MSKSASSNREKPRLAFLGPPGTYSHQAALECFGDSVEYVAQPTITDVQQALSADVPFGIIPQENSTNGSVAETYNLLRVPAVGQETFVRGATVLRVKHSLVIRRGTKLKDIETVMSHEQALGQCREWLAAHLPRASLVPTNSTAGAAKSLLSTENELDPMKCAAICSSVIVTMHEGLEVLEEGIQDGPGNFTRFYVLSQGIDLALPEGCILLAENKALFRLQTPGDPSEPVLNIPEIIGMLDLSVLRVDRRPRIHARSFNDVYFLEVAAIPGHDYPGQLWIERVRQTADKVKHTGVDVSLLGCW